MLVGLSRNTGPPNQIQSGCNILHLPRPVNIVWIDKRCQLRRPISVSEHCKKPEIGTERRLSQKSLDESSGAAAVSSNIKSYLSCISELSAFFWL